MKTFFDFAFIILGLSMMLIGAWHLKQAEKLLEECKKVMGMDEEGAKE